MGNNVILAFLQELFNRLGKKNPTFFKVFSWIGAAAGLVAGLPEFIQWLGITNLPDWFTVLESKSIGIAGTVIFIMSNLTVNKETMTSVSQATKLPFTEKKDVNTP